MNQEQAINEDSYEMKFDVGTIKHLGLQMYSTLPPVIGELVANAWDANATKVEITIPTDQINESTSEIIIQDNGIGMSDEDVRDKYLIIGRDRRADEKTDVTLATNGCKVRKVMGRKGIGKFSSFGIAKEIEIESVKKIEIENVKKIEISRLVMNYEELLKRESQRYIELPKLPPTNSISCGTKITLRNIIKFRNRKISIEIIRRGLARRFAVIGATHNFDIVINDESITPEDRDLQRLLEKDLNDELYIWKYNEEIEKGTGWTVSGWIGALKKSTPNIDKVDRGIVLMARGKLVQEPFVFNANVGQQYALSYLIGELHVDFVDETEDMVSTTRNALVWDTEPNRTLME